MEHIGLDQKTLKALAAETRVRMLKLLDQKQMTISDLAGELRMSLPTVTEHVAALLNAGLVRREETTRKWKYYSLLPKARMLLHPHTAVIWFVLGLFLFSAAATAFSAIRFLAPVEGLGGLAEARMAAQPEALAAPAMAEAVPALATPAFPLWLIVFGCVAVLSLIALAWLLHRHGWLGKSLSNKKNI